MKLKYALFLAIVGTAILFAGCGSSSYPEDDYGYNSDYYNGYPGEIAQKTYSRYGDEITTTLGGAGSTPVTRPYRHAPAVNAVSPPMESNDSSSGDSWGDDYDSSDPGDYEYESKSELRTVEKRNKPVTNPESPEAGVIAQRAQKIIYTANMILGVYDPDDIKKKVIEALSQLGGFVQEESNTRLVLRVPADYFKIMVEEIIKYGRIISKNIFTQDVTEEFYDLVTRLVVMKDTLVVLTEMLKHAKTKQLQLEILREMRILQEQIERSEARLRYLKDKVSYSTITLDLRLEQQMIQTPKHVKIPVYWLNSHGLENLIS